MKLSQSFVSASLAYCFAGVTASDTPLGQVFHVNPVSGQQPSSIPTVDPETARLILAQKLGLAQFHSLSGASRESLDQINEVAGDPVNPFLELISLPEFPALIIIDGVKKPEDLSFSADPLFRMSQTPSPSANAQFLKDLFTQATSLSSHYDDNQNQMRSDIHAAFSELPGHHSYDMSHVSTSHVDLHGVDGDDYNENIAKVRDGLGRLYQSSEMWRHPVTVMVFPADASSINKRSDSPYGAYAMPKKSNQVRSAAPRFSPNVRDESDIVTGVLPSCFDSKSKCEKLTKSCSGRGDCIAKYKAEGEDQGTCFQCLCNKPDKRKVSGGTKMTYWGGAACQKKDVTMPFWLLSGITIFLTSAVFWGIGLIYSMGSEELPSVIGAGVSGPKAR